MRGGAGAGGHGVWRGPCYQVCAGTAGLARLLRGRRAPDSRAGRVASEDRLETANPADPQHAGHVNLVDARTWDARQVLRIRGSPGHYDSDHRNISGTAIAPNGASLVVGPFSVPHPVSKKRRRADRGTRVRHFVACAGTDSALQQFQLDARARRVFAAADLQ